MPSELWVIVGLFALGATATTAYIRLAIAIDDYGRAEDG